MILSSKVTRYYIVVALAISATRAVNAGKHGRHRRLQTIISECGKGFDSCNTLPPAPPSPETACSDPIYSLEVSYQNNFCFGSIHDQSLDIRCIDFAPGIDFEQDAYIVCRENTPQGSSRLHLSRSVVEPGGTFKVFGFTEDSVLPDKIKCNIEDSSRNVLQENLIVPLESGPLHVGDTFGALRVEACINTIPTDPPTPNPTPVPTTKAPVSPAPTAPPTSVPTKEPTSSPTESPISSPTVKPTDPPTSLPTNSPTSSPTMKPTIPPTSAPTPPSACPLYNLDFDDLEGGTYVTDQLFDTFGVTIEAIPAGDSGFAPNGAARIFDTSNPVTNGDGDSDLGTPNNGCGGPGVGAGGAPSSEYSNCDPLENVLIIQESDKTVPDDTSTGGTIVLSFRYPAIVEELAILDIDDAGASPTIEVVDTDKNVWTFEIEGVGDNGVFPLEVGVGQVTELRVIFPSSGALAYVDYHVCPELAPSAEPSTPPTPAPTFPPSTASPTEQPTGTECEVQVTIECTLASEVPCQDYQPTGDPDDCFQEIFYNIDIENVGSNDMAITVVDFTFNTETTSILGQVLDPNLEPGDSVSLQESTVQDLCLAFDFSASVMVKADPPDPTFPCQGTASVDFEGTPQPTEAPSPGPTPVPTLAPTVSRTEQPTGTECEVLVTIDCNMATGEPCEDYEPSDDPEECLQEFIYDIGIENVGTNDMAITVVNFTFNEQTTSILGRVSDPDLAPGDNTTLKVTRARDFCGSYEFAASVLVEADPPDPTFPCQGTASFEFEGTPQPTPAPTPAPTAVPTTVPTVSPTEKPSVAPTFGPTPIPTERPTGTVCEVVVEIECTLSDGEACEDYEPTGDPADCLQILKYDISITNVGTNNMAITVVDFTFNQQTTSVLELVPNPDLAPGDNVTLAATSEQDLCVPYEFIASVLVEADPPDPTFPCQGEAIIAFDGTPRPTVAPTPGPTSVPTSVPTPVPTEQPTGTECEVLVSIDCVLGSGESCEDYQSTGDPDDCFRELIYNIDIENVGTNDMTITVVNFTFIEATESVLEGNPTLTPGDSATYGLTTVQDLCGSFDYSASVLVEADPPDPTFPCQGTAFVEFEGTPQPTVAPSPGPTPVPTVQPTGTECEVQVIIDCNMASGEPCEDYEPTDAGDCLQQEFIYDVIIENIGTNDMSVTVLDFVFNERTTSILGRLTDPDLAPGDNTTVTARRRRDFCGSYEFAASVLVEADPPDPTFPCQGMASFEFEGTARPTPVPTPMPTPAPTIAPTASPTEQPTGTECDVSVDIDCMLATGESCEDYEQSGDPFDCLQELTYSISIENVGTNDMAITLIDFTFNEETTSILARVLDPDLMPGDNVTIKETTEEDLCGSYEFQASVVVEADPPDPTFPCKGSASFDFEGTPRPTLPPTGMPSTRPPTPIPTALPTSVPTHTPTTAPPTMFPTPPPSPDPTLPPTPPPSPDPTIA